MRIIQVCTIILLASVAAAPAWAGRHPIAAAADNYREAVKDFEQAVFRANDLGRVERRIADALEDQTSRVRREARDLDDLPRLEKEIGVALSLHQQVETLILASPNRRTVGFLIPDWQRVEFAFTEVVRQFESLRGPVFGLTAPAVDFPIHQQQRSGFRGLPQPGFGPRSPLLGPVDPRLDPRLDPRIAPPVAVPYCPAPGYSAPAFESSRLDSSSFQSSKFRRNAVGRFGVGAYLQR